MKKSTLLVSFFAVLALTFVSFASASSSLADNVYVELNGEEIFVGDNTLGSFAGDVVPIKVTFTAGADAEDVRIKVSIYDGKDDVTDITGRFNVREDVKYTKLLSLKLPSDLDEEYDDLTLEVKIYDADSDNDNYNEDYDLQVQRESYELEILSVDYNSQVSAGDVFPVSVVLRNDGYNRVDDNYVVVSIPELGVSTRAYVGDLIPTEDYDEDEDDKYDRWEDEEDTVQKTVYLKVPSNVASGVYALEVTAYNDDSETTVQKVIGVGESASTELIVTARSQEIAAGETKTYDLILVNSEDNVKVFNVAAVSGSDLVVSVPAVVTVSAGSSQTVPVTVSAADDADVGAYTFTVDVDGEQVVFTANVIGESVSTSVVALTVVLVIVFVVLLAVLVILLTRKEKPIEEVETSYY